MPNTGYPDDDGSRTAQGAHDEGTQRVSCYDASKTLRPATLAQMQYNDDHNNASDSWGDRLVPNCGWSLDGVASAGTAAFPPKPEDPNARD